MFEIHLALCRDFTSLNPFIIRETEASEVFALWRRRNNYIRLNNNAQHITKKENKVRVDPRKIDWL